MRQKIEEWATAEREFGVEFSSFDRLFVGNTSRNFKATSRDGRRFLVKFGKTRALENARILESGVSCPLLARMAFGGHSFAFGNCVCFAFEWIADARSVRPQDLALPQIRSLSRAYARLSDALKDVDVGEGDGRAIHGDLHYDNILFRGDEVVAFLDFEMMRRGLPTEDLVRIFCHRLERLRFWRVIAIRRVYTAFRELVRACGYSRADWLTAIDRAEMDKRTSRLRKRRVTGFVHIENSLVAWVYQGLRGQVDEAGL